MAVIENHVQIARPPEVVFDYASDLRNELHWNPEMQRVEKVTDGPIGIGTRFRAKWRASKVVNVEVKRYDRPRRWTNVADGPVQIVFDAHVEPTPTGSRLTVRFDARPRGFFRLVFPLFLLLMRRQERANMVHLKRAVEALPVGAPTPERV